MPSQLLFFMDIIGAGRRRSALALRMPWVLWLQADRARLPFGGWTSAMRSQLPLRSRDVHHENRITIDATPGFLLPPEILVRDRSWLELRWIDGNYSTTYRNMLTVERPFLVHGVRFSPYASAEVFYDSPKHSWDQEWYTAGIQWPYKRLLMLETYYRRENCDTCTPTNWNAAGMTLNFYFSNTR
jgi:hypothetical protein